MPITLITLLATKQSHLISSRYPPLLPPPAQPPISPAAATAIKTTTTTETDMSMPLSHFSAHKPQTAASVHRLCAPAVSGRRAGVVSYSAHHIRPHSHRTYSYHTFSLLVTLWVLVIGGSCVHGIDAREIFCQGSQFGNRRGDGMSVPPGVCKLPKICVFQPSPSPLVTFMKRFLVCSAL